MTDLATTHPLEAFDMLDVYEGVRTTEARIDALATVSAGFRNDKGLPQASRDGTIHLHDPEGRAPGLAAALEATGRKVLTITVPFDDPRKFVQQRYMRYSASSLEVYGDQHQLTEIVPLTSNAKGDTTRAEHITHRAGSDRYAELLTTCKVSVSFYFLLAEWGPSGPRILMPDGAGLYRLRFTSRGSLANLMAQLRLVSELSGGRLAGIPFDLRLVNREVADPTGRKRKVPVWTIVMNRPGQMTMDSGAFRAALEGGVREASKLRLPPPRAETLELARLELADATGSGPDLDLDSVELDDDDARMLETGIDYRHRLKQWHAAARDTFLEDEEERHDFLAEHTPYSSSRDAAKYLSQPEWDDLLEAATLAIRERGEARQEAASAEAALEPERYPEDVTEEMLAFLARQYARTGLRQAVRLDFYGFLLGAEVRVERDLTRERIEAILRRFGEVNGKFKPYPDAAIADLVLAYREWAASDEAAGAVLG